MERYVTEEWITNFTKVLATMFVMTDAFCDLREIAGQLIAQNLGYDDMVEEEDGN